MKKETHRKILGVTQEEMAMLLGSNRINIAMYETGRRELPVHSIQLFTTLLSYHQDLKEPSESVQNLINSEKENKIHWLKSELRTTNYKLSKLDTKIAALEHKRVEAIAALETVCYLEGQAMELVFPDVKSFINSRATMLLKNNPLKKLEELKLKKEQLDFLKKSLEDKLK